MVAGGRSKEKPHSLKSFSCDGEHTEQHTTRKANGRTALKYLKQKEADTSPCYTPPSFNVITVTIILFGV